jgi:hypothetical protein
MEERKVTFGNGEHLAISKSSDSLEISYNDQTLVRLSKAGNEFTVPTDIVLQLLKPAAVTMYKRSSKKAATSSKFLSTLRNAVEDNDEATPGIQRLQEMDYDMSKLSDPDILDVAIEVMKKLMRDMLGFQVSEDVRPFRPWLSQNPRVSIAWRLTCELFDILTATPIEDCIAEWEEREESLDEVK